MFEKYSLYIVQIMLGTMFFLACAVPRQLRTEDIPVVPELDLQRYLGTWFEIARFDHRFEKDLDSVTATYSLRADGKIKVLNKAMFSNH